MPYIKTTWVNDSTPAISAANLNKIEAGIADATSTAEAAQSDAAGVADLEADTGWRNITSLLSPAPVAGTVYLRRKHNTVTLLLQSVDPGASIPQWDFYTLPDGFRTDLIVAYYVPAGATTSQRAINVYTSGVLRIWAAASGDSYRQRVEFNTADAWPTALPGTAA